MKNPNCMQEANSHREDDGDYVQESSRNDMATTWPPQSYTCTFCKREFRSAQALGGHMNVHRRDRARLCQTQPNFIRNSNVSSSSSSSSSSSTLLMIPPQDHVANGGRCLLYSLPKPDAIFKPSSLNDIKGGSTPHSFNSSLLNYSNTEASTSTNCGSEEKVGVEKKRKRNDVIVEGVDLELRLGCSSLAS